MRLFFFFSCMYLYVLLLPKVSNYFHQVTGSNCTAALRSVGMYSGMARCVNVYDNRLDLGMEVIVHVGRLRKEISTAKMSAGDRRVLQEWSQDGKSIEFDEGVMCDDIFAKHWSFERLLKALRNLVNIGSDNVFQLLGTKSLHEPKLIWKSIGYQKSKTVKMKILNWHLQDDSHFVVLRRFNFPQLTIN